jgi:hypothetical protein
LSDLDAIMYFPMHESPLHPELTEPLKIFHSLMAVLYDQMPFLKPGDLADVFIIDDFHGQDGRFMMFDRDWTDAFHNYSKWKPEIGSAEFMTRMSPVNLRNQNEFELALGLHLLRAYLFFEIPRGPDKMSIPYAKGIAKFFKVLPRTASIITHNPMVKSPQKLLPIFPQIDFSALNEFWVKMSDCDTEEAYLKSWHEPENPTFINCLECFEAVLADLVNNHPARSV